MSEQSYQTAGHALDVESALNSSVVGQHLLLAEFVLPFAPGEEDPTGTTSSVTNGRAQLWINDGTLWLSIYSSTLGEWTTVGAFQAIGGDATFDSITVNGDITAENVHFTESVDGDGDSILYVTNAVVEGEFAHTGNTFGVFGTAPANQPSIFGDKATQTAVVLGQVISAGVDLGLWIDGTT